ncbi:MAG TPA: SRPBCC domain-containing protein [Caulobacteraceae bacterium]|jgi:hypothetical protein
MRVKLEHRTGVRASAETIWRLIADIEAWPNWNPLYTKAQGVIRMGAPLDLEVTLPGQAPRAIRPVVLDWIPNEQLLWQIKMLGGLIKSIRYFEIEELAPGSCIFSNGEMFDGMLGPSVARRLREPIRAGFRAMGEAVKSLAEHAAGAEAG